jgi:hypothetical protein
MQTQGIISGSSDVPNWRFVGQTDDEADVYWNPFTKRWEVRIVICDPFGTIEDYGFIPNEPDLEIDEDLIVSITNKPKPQETIEEIVSEEETKTGLSKDEIELKKKELEQEDRRIKLEEQRSERINKLLQKYLDGDINTETFERLLNLI